MQAARHRGEAGCSSVLVSSSPSAMPSARRRRRRPLALPPSKESVFVGSRYPFGRGASAGASRPRDAPHLLPPTGGGKSRCCGRRRGRA